MANFREQNAFAKTLQPDQIVRLNFPNYGVIFGKITKELYDELYAECLQVREKDLAEKDFRPRLAGNLNHEYDLIQKADAVTPTVMVLLEQYESYYGFLKTVAPNVKDTKLVINSLWVNFMEKHDFNPVHNHGGIFSFVIWLKIPYDLNAELEKYPKTNLQAASTFCFHYTNILGEIEGYTVDVDKDYEGVICLFPAKLCHSVNPFSTTDENRISIAGNLYLDNR